MEYLAATTHPGREANTRETSSGVMKREGRSWKSQPQLTLTLRNCPSSSPPSMHSAAFAASSGISNSIAALPLFSPAESQHCAKNRRSVGSLRCSQRCPLSRRTPANEVHPPQLLLPSPTPLCDGISLTNGKSRQINQHHPPVHSENLLQVAFVHILAQSINHDHPVPRRF